MNNKKYLDQLSQELVKDSIDMHIHGNPHIHPENHMADVIELTRKARDFGMKALVFKDVSFPTMSTAYLVKKFVSGIQVFGSLVLNLSCGGINAYAINAAIEHIEKPKVIWFPTGDALHHVKERAKINYKGINLQIPVDEAISIVKNEKLSAEAENALEQIFKNDICLATGHLSPNETIKLVERANKIGIKKMVITHCMWKMIGFNLEQLKYLIKLGAFLEFDFQLCLPIMQFVHSEIPINPEDMVKVIKEVGAERCILSTDTGQAYAPPPHISLKYFISILLKCGLNENEISLMVNKNPSFLLGII